MNIININGWHIPENEEDLPIVESAERAANTIDYNDWHNNFIRDILELYTPDMKRRVALDIGGCVGMMAVPLSKHYEQVYTFEMNPDTRECLKLNTQHYSNISVMDYGVSDHNGFAKFKKKKSSGNSKISKDGDHLYEVRTIDSFNFDNVDLIKMDIEGHEYEALLGSINTIKMCEPIIITEIYSRRTRGGVHGYRSRQNVLNTMYGLGYKLKDVRRNDYIWRKE